MNSFSSFVRAGLFCFVAASIPLSTGCGMDVSVSGSTGTGGGSTGSGGGSTSSVSGGSQSTGAGGAPMSTGVSTGVGGGAFCGGFAGIPCAADEFCDFPNNSCGNADGSGTCQKRPMACATIYAPVCGCDGQVHGNACSANTAGQDVASAGACPAPDGLFACGEQFCDLKSQYCQVQISDVGAEPNTYTCKLLPAGCGASPACACLVNEPCGNACTAPSAGGLQLSCPGG